MSFTNIIIVEKKGFPENDLGGGYTYSHGVISCDVDPTIGTLEYGRRSFDPVPYFGPEPREETPPAPSGSFSKHVSTMKSLLDEEIAALREDHGITVLYR